MLIVIILLLLSSCSEETADKRFRDDEALKNFELHQRFELVFDAQKNFKNAVERDNLANQHKDEASLYTLPTKFTNSLNSSQ